MGAHNVEELCGLLKRPRRVMMMVKAGSVVDETIAQIVPHLEHGDVLIDGGNSLFSDSDRRIGRWPRHGILYVRNRRVRR